MKNKEKFIFWFLLVILVISRLINIINTHVLTVMEGSNLFVSSYIAGGGIPSPVFFQVNQPHVGGGHLIYSIMAAPFLLFFGKSYFSLRLASIIYVVLTYLVTYRFCKKYFGFVTAVFVSFLFVITPGLLTEFSVIGEGRHFHLNLFFIFSLYCLARIKDTKKLLYYLLLGMTCGLGVYFYPAFLVTVFVLGLFLLTDMDIKKPSFIYGYLIFISCVTLAGNFLQFQTPWYHNFYKILSYKAAKHTKHIIIYDDIFKILNRFATLFLKVIPNIFASSRHDFQVLFRQPFKEYFHNLTTISRIPLEIFRLIFVTSCALLCWINRGELKKTISNAFSLRSKHVIPSRGYITIFLLAHLFIYIFIYGFNCRYMDNHKFYIPLFLNIILIPTIFFSQIWQRNKTLSIILLVLTLLPGISYQYHNFTKASMKDFYRNYLCFYGTRPILEFIMGKRISVLKLMCDRLNINFCHAVGDCYAIKNPDKVQKDFEYLGGGDMRKLKYLYQGYIFGKVTGSKDKIKSFSSIMKKIDEKYRKFCYIGLGESLFSWDPSDIGKFPFKKNKKMIEELTPYVEEDYKRYFFQGIGEGLAKVFERPYSSYITEDGVYDYNILQHYATMIDDKESRKAFLTGFCNKDIWTPY